MKSRLLLLPAVGAVLIGLAACASPSAPPPSGSGNDAGAVSTESAAPEATVESPASDPDAFCTWLDGIKTFESPTGEPWHTTSADAGCTWPNAARQYVTVDLNDRGSVAEAEAWFDRYTANGANTPMTIPGTSQASWFPNSSTAGTAYAIIGNWSVSCYAVLGASAAEQCTAMITAIASEYAL